MQTEGVPEARVHFDQAAESWDENPGRLLMARQHCEAILQHIPLTKNMSVLDYGCGTGLVSLGLLPRVGTLLGLDGSQGMVARFNEKIRSGNHSNCRALFFEPEKALLPGIADRSIDLIVSTMTFHHIPDIQAVLREFKRALVPGGRVCVLDLAKEDGSFHTDPDAGVVHLGFSEAELREAFAFVGLKDIVVETAFVHNRPATGRSYPVLMAVGVS